MSNFESVNMIVKTAKKQKKTVKLLCQTTIAEKIKSTYDPTMTRADLNQEISRKNKINATEVSVITNALFEIIKDEITKGNKITLKGFGTFKTKKRAAKKVQLIKQKRTIDLAAHFIPTFLPSKFFLKR